MAGASTNNRILHLPNTYARETALDARAVETEAAWRGRFSLLLAMASVALLASVAALVVTILR